MYPMPKDTKVFDRRYREEHHPYAGPRLVSAGATGVTTKKVVGAQQFYWISDVAFPSMEALQKCASSQGAKEALEHAASISTGGAPTVLLVSDEA
jgi:hypothetical protein